MKIGYSRLTVTPPLGVMLGGMGSPRECIGVLDDICATAIAFSDGEETAVAITIDILELAKKDNDVIRDMISSSFGIKRNAIFVHATHSHSTPEVSGHMFEPLPEYVDFFYKRVRDAAGFAIDDMKESKVFVATGEAKDGAYVRRYIMKDGSGKTNPPPNAEVLSPETVPDNTVPLIKIEREGGHDIAIVSFSVHPCTCAGKRITADFVHFVRLTLEQALSDVADGRGCKVAYFSGALGDGVAKNYCDTTELGYKYSRHIGRNVAAAVLSVYTYAEPVNTDKLSYRVEEVHVESFGRPEGYRLLLSCIGIGDVAFMGFPGEPYNALGKRIKKECAFKMTIPCCNTNDWHSYIPMSEAYKHGGYGVDNNGKRPGCAEAFIEKAIAISKELTQNSTN